MERLVVCKRNTSGYYSKITPGKEYILINAHNKNTDSAYYVILNGCGG